MKFTYPVGATPIDPDEAAGLLPSHISTQSDLNTWEEANILQGAAWAQRQKKRELLEEGFVRELHKQMFNRTWRWAGTFRASNKNIGVDWAHVSVRLNNLLVNTQYQMSNAIFAADELAVRFHHQLVWIHPFPNGNGRHARLLADTLVVRLGRKRFSWGANALPTGSELRHQYLEALRAADTGEYERLLAFARR